MPRTTYDRPDRLLSKAAVSRRLAVSTTTVGRLLARGDLPFTRVGERGIRVRESVVEAYVDARTERRGAS
jgi:excisionase family DNA binding protein